MKNRFIYAIYAVLEERISPKFTNTDMIEDICGQIYEIFIREESLNRARLEEESLNELSEFELFEELKKFITSKSFRVVLSRRLEIWRILYKNRGGFVEQ